MKEQDDHLEGGAFDPTPMIWMLQTSVQDALAAVKGASRDMTWSLDEARGCGETRQSTSPPPNV